MYIKPIDLLMTWLLNLKFLGQSSKPNPSFVYAVSVTHSTSSWRQRNAACLCFKAKEQPLSLHNQTFCCRTRMERVCVGTELPFSSRWSLFPKWRNVRTVYSFGYLTSLCRKPKNFPSSCSKQIKHFVIICPCVFSLFSLQTEQQCVFFKEANPGSYHHPTPTTKLARHKE